MRVNAANAVGTLQPVRLPLQESLCEKLGHVFWPEIR
jgi:hypothetical protein